MKITALDIVGAVEGTLLQGSPEQIFTSVSTDSRILQPGGLFFALKGTSNDGHDFLPDAERRGAAGAVVTRRPEGVKATLGLIQVKDTLAALGKSAGWWRRRFDIPCLAVTGSSGKTTTKEMAAKILNDRFPTLANEENLNTEIGVPLTLFRLEDHHRALVLELAMRGKGQIAHLAAMLEPVVGVITNVGTAHLGLLGSTEAIREAKLELAGCLKAGGSLVVPADDPVLKEKALQKAEKVVTFGFGMDSDIRGVEVAADGPGASFKVHFRQETAEVHLPVPGIHNVLNALAAMAAATQLGVGLAEAAAALESFQPLRMRCQAVQTAAGVTILNDSYNANPESTRAALRVLSVWPCEGKRIAVLGDMLELGDFGREAHLQTGREAATLGVDMILAVGDLAEAIAEGAQATEGFKGEVHRCRTKQDAMELLLNAIRPGSVVLVKGSRMTGMDEVVRALQDDSFRAAASGSESSGRAVSY